MRFESQMGAEVPWWQQPNKMETVFIITKKNGNKLLLTSNLNQADVAGLNIQDIFTKEVIEIWSNLNYE